MNNNTRNAFASYGLEILKRSVLLVLYEQHVSGSPEKRFLSMKEICQWIDLPVPNARHKHSLIHGILLYLREDRSVVYLPEYGSVEKDQWQITEEGVSLIEA